MTSQSVSIRRARSEEAHTLTLVARESKAYWKYSAAILEEWKSQLCITPYQIMEEAVWLAERGQDTLGYYRVSAAAGSCELADLFVLPSAIGQGIGRSLLQHAMGTARDLGHGKMAIDADPFAEKFYLAMGAVRVGEIVAPIEGDLERVRPQLLLLID